MAQLVNHSRSRLFIDYKDGDETKQIQIGSIDDKPAKGRGPHQVDVDAKTLEALNKNRGFKGLVADETISVHGA
jgi:hypothetical protein